MKKLPQMGYDDPNRATLARGKIGEVIMKFSQSGKIDFACLQPGYYDVGMKGAVAVTAGQTTRKGDQRGNHKP